MLKFAEWLSLQEGDRLGAKYGLYPPGYDGQGLYPLQVFMTKSADAITYLSNPKLATNDGPPFSILHIQGSSSQPKSVDSKGIVKPKSVDSKGIVKPGDVDKSGVVKPKNVMKTKRHSHGDETLQ